MENNFYNKISIPVNKDLIRNVLMPVANFLNISVEDALEHLLRDYRGIAAAHCEKCNKLLDHVPGEFIVICPKCKKAIPLKPKPN